MTQHDRPSPGWKSAPPWQPRRIELLDERLEAVARESVDQGFDRLADAFDIKPGYERALAAALAEDAEALVVPDRSGLIEFACSAAGMNARAFVPRSGDDAVAANSTQGSSLPGTGLSELATVRRGQSASISQRLAGVRVVDDLNAAARALINPTGLLLLVTREGVAFDPVGLRVWSVGDSAVADRYEIQNQRDAAAIELETAIGDLGGAREARERAQTAVVAAEQALKSAREGYSAAQGTFNEAQTIAARLRAQLTGLERERDDLDRRLERLTAEDQSAREAIAQWERDDAGLTAQLAEVRAAHEVLARRV